MPKKKKPQKQLSTEKRKKVNFRIKDSKNLPYVSKMDELHRCASNYNLNLSELAKLQNLEDYLTEKGVDGECMDIINMHISRVPPPERPPISFLIQLASCHKFLVDSGLGDDDTTSDDLNKLLTVIESKISEEGMTPDNKIKLELLKKCHDAYLCYGL